MADRAAQVALHTEREELLRSAVQMAREAAGTDTAMAAVENDHGTYDMRVRDGIRDPRFADISIQPGRGLGGQILAEPAPRALDDYQSESTITADWKPIMRAEGLRGIACVPVAGPDGTEALLYVSSRSYGAPGGRAIDELRRVSDLASVGLHHIAARTRERELAVLRERQHLATLLHDSVAQALFAIGVAAQQSRESDDPSIVQAQLEEIEQTAAQARHELRETLARLNRAPEGLAFESQFEAELRLFERRTGRRVWVTRKGEPRAFGRDPEQLLIDSVREALTNAGKHGAGSVVLAHLAYQADRVLMSVQTELGPPGRDVLPRRPELAIEPGSGLGLLRDRLHQHGGQLELSFEEDGTGVLRVELSA